MSERGAHAVTSQPSRPGEQTVPRAGSTRRGVLTSAVAGLMIAGGSQMMSNAAAQSTMATPSSDASAALQPLIDRAAILDVVDGIDLAVDAKDWERCRHYFTDEIYADFTSLAGGDPGRIPADALVDGWRTSLYADKLSHHMRTNHRITIDGDQAEVLSKGEALNILARGLGDNLWQVWGDYTHTLDRTPEGWKCSGMTFVVTYARGNETVRDFVPER